MCLPHLQDVQDANLAGYNRILHLNATQLGTRVTVQYSRQHQAGGALHPAHLSFYIFTALCIEGKVPPLQGCLLFQ